MTQKEALDILKTGANVFLTGEPGAGKTHTINEYIKYLRDRDVEVAITASTGIAATHIGGMTIHSWSGIGIKRKLDKYDLDKIASSEFVSKRIRRARVLVIDEISMLSSETLSMVDAVCREVKQTSEVFGGLQIVFVGDFFQLPPVVRKENFENEIEETLFEEEENSIFAFGSSAWKKAGLIVCYITEQYRQDDEDFLSILSAIRANTFNKKHLHQIELRKVTRENLPEKTPKLYSHNVDVDYVNTETLSKIENSALSYKMSGEGPDGLVSVLKKGCLSPENLSLKIGAEVMFTKNNLKEGFVNGTLGTVIGFEQNYKHPIVRIRNGKLLTVLPMEWSVEENGKIRAKINQIPLRLAWAITVHKSQGMSMDGAIMDLSEVFEYGQGYVALSRVRRLSGLHILGLNRKAFEVHPEILLQDKIFKNQSIDAKNTFMEIPKERLFKMHNDFIVALGGRVLKDGAPRGIIKLKKDLLKKPKEEKSGKLKELRKKFPNAYRSWNKDEDERLSELFREGVRVKDLAKEFGRKRGAISARLEKLELVK